MQFSLLKSEGSNCSFSGKNATVFRLKTQKNKNKISSVSNTASNANKSL